MAAATIGNDCTHLLLLFLESRDRGSIRSPGRNLDTPMVIHSSIRLGPASGNAHNLISFGWQMGEEESL